MTEKKVTIIVSPREQFGMARRSLESIYQHTSIPFDLVYVDTRSPRSHRRWLERESKDRGFKLLYSHRLLTPNESRNLAISQIDSEYIAFVDNDLLVTPAWLETLVDCADQTGAAAVGPLILEGEPEDNIIHMAGGSCSFEGESPNRRFLTDHLFQKQVASELETELARGRCDFIEFHCALVRRDMLDKLGPLDEQLLNTREHLDLCLQIHDAGGDVYFEPQSIVTYKAPPPLALVDIPFFSRRWSEDWTKRSLVHFVEKYGLDDAYAERSVIATARREIIFTPAVSAVESVLGKRVGAFTYRICRRLEAVSNRLLCRAIPRMTHR